MTPADLDAAAGTLFGLLGTGRSLDAPLAPGLDMPAAYAVAARIREKREARGERPLGRKIGFTNTTIWPRYGVAAPMWGHVYDTTVHDPAAPLALAGLAEPRIEPEIVFGLRDAPAVTMDDTALLACIGWVAPGFEIVQSVYPGWRFSLAEATAAFGLHGALLVGGRRAVDDPAALADFTIRLRRNGIQVAEGEAGFVLGGPLKALRFLVQTLEGTPYPLRPGEIVTTGTLTDAQPVAAGERWSASFHGVDLDDLHAVLR